MQTGVANQKCSVEDLLCMFKGVLRAIAETTELQQVSNRHDEGAYTIVKIKNQLSAAPAEL
jgi:hypothetical protein